MIYFPSLFPIVGRRCGKPFKSLCFRSDGGDRSHDIRIKRRPQNTPKPRRFRVIQAKHPRSSGSHLRTSRRWRRASDSAKYHTLHHTPKKQPTEARCRRTVTRCGMKRRGRDLNPQAREDAGFQVCNRHPYLSGCSHVFQWFCGSHGKLSASDRARPRLLARVLVQRLVPQ